MPTMTHVLERRRLQRYSLDNQLETHSPRRVRHSLTSAANKENFGVHFTRSPFGNTSLTAFQDLSNGKSPLRVDYTPTRPPLRCQTQGNMNLNVKRRSGTPTSRSRFSDDFVNPEPQDTPLSHLRFRSASRDDSLSSSRMGDVTLDRMLDAIIESARKDVKHVHVVNPRDSAQQHGVKSALRSSSPTVVSDSEISVHEMEVRTPTHLKRQRVVRRKNTKTTESRRKIDSKEAKSIGNVTPPPPQPQSIIGVPLPDDAHSPDTPLFKPSAATNAELLAMQTPPNSTEIVDTLTTTAMAGARTVEAQSQQRCSTPTLEETHSIKRCLSFSSTSDDEYDVDFSNAAKRSSVASSNTSSTMGDQFGSGQTSRHSQGSWKAANSAAVRGHVELSIQVEQQQLNVHVIRCRDLQRPNGSTALNAYVKVALIRNKPASKKMDNHFQRTAVHRHSSRPYFDHRFKFDLGAKPQTQQQTKTDVAGERLQLAVWHRDRQLKRSEFLGCMSFPLHTLLQQPVNGFYKLQSQACLNKPQSPILLQYPVGVTHTAQVHSQTHQTPSPKLRNNQNHSSNDKFIHLNSHLQPQTAVPETSVANAVRTMTSTLTRQKSEEDVMSIDSMAQATAGNNIEHPMTLSRKALHQRDADENLFLRFLELDPPTDTAATTNAASATPSASGGRRLSATSKSVGRTPFTMTKKLTRTAERGFGFSIVWTHPPRVEKIEPGLSADRAGIQPGDYVIFVDKQNVVTMPEADVLNLIRSQGSTLTLEVFRRTGPTGGVGLGSMPPALSVGSRGHPPAPVMNGKATPNTRLASTISDEQQSVTGGPTLSARRVGVPSTAPISAAAPATTIAVTNVRPSTACSGGTTSSIEAAKRRLHLPQVTFSKESIGPITDNRRRLLLQLISREQNFIAALHFGMQRFVQPLQDRKDLISPNDHRTLFQNIDELLRISEDILEQLCNDDQEPQMNFASRVYLSKTTAICAAYKKYCNGIKRADCVLVNKSRQMGSEFVAFITEPQVPRKRPDLTMFIHRPLQHFREILKLMQLLASNCHVDTEEHKNFTTVIAELQAAYREITVSSGLMEPLGEGRPLLTLQDLESRMVFTKCKPFTLAVQGRQWIFGGDLSRVEGRSVKPYWTLLFSDIIVFAKVSRDRVLFITEEPIPIANIVDSCFHMRKKTTEFRLTVDPNGRLAESPTGYCAPDLTRTPKKSARRKSLLLRAPSLELKAVWQNLLQRQIFLVNAALGSTPLSSPLDSPDVLNTLVPLSDIGIASASIGSIKHSSMDSINAKNSQQQQKRHSNASEQIEMLIDEKCRILNKTGTSKSNALHLANWMKGQLDKQQEQARLAAQRSRENISHEEEHLLYPETDQDERITFWTRQQLEKRTKELNLAKENGSMKARPNFGGKRLSGVEELSMSEAYSENVSQLSQSHSTTSDSQITVRSSPIVLDKLAVCRHCHKNCQQAALGLQQSMSPTMPTSHPQRSAIGAMIAEGSAGGGSGSGLVCTSLKVQHSQSSPNRCCRLNGNASQAGSTTSISSSTITGEQPSEHSSKVVASSSKRETGDTESDVAQLITDDLSQSEATDDSIGGIPSSSSGVAAADEIQRRLTDSFSKLRILDERREAKGLDAKPGPQPMPRIQDPQHIHQTVFMNGYCLSSSSSGDRDNENKAASVKKPQPQPRTYRVTLQTATKETAKEAADKKVKTTVTITETAQIIRTQEQDQMPEAESAHFVDTSRNTTKSSKSPHTPIMLKSPKSPGTPASVSRFIACNCQCTPADFKNTTLSPDEVEQQTCKLIDSPKQSPQMPRQLQLQESANSIISEKTLKYCKCICGGQSLVTAKDEQSSFQFNGLSARQFNTKVTPTTPLPTPTSTSAPAPLAAPMYDSTFVPTIAVVPPTPEAMLTMTSTNVWDNSGTNLTTSTTTQLQLNNTPRQAVIENIPEDSCDESPLDEEPPYRPMSNALRRYGTMSSLEKLPSDDRMDDEIDELDNDDDKSEVPDDTEEDDDDLDDKARADTVDNLCETSKSSVYSNEVVAGGSCVLVGGVWTSRAGGLVGGNKMSFFEESRAFIDKYLGRWNQEQTTSSPAATTSETDEQADECTSGATSGEEVWGTPTSGGDNDDMHLVNSENTYSSPTKSSNSLNDDDDTELMMDELLMAPPMTASTIRGLLPRRRLEPLFEEETESDEEKTQQESDDVKKGETTTNGHYLKDSAGSSSDEDLSNEKSYELELEENENQTPFAPKAPHIHGRILLPTSIPTSWEQAFAQSQPPHMANKVALPIGVLKASSCEYLLEQRTMVPLRTTSITSSPPTVRATSATPMKATTPPLAKVEVELEAASQQTVTMQVEMKATMRSTTTMMMTTTRTIKTPPSPRNQPHSSISTTINSASASIVKSSCNNGSGSTQTTSTTTVRPAKFVPPPPPPRRLLLTQTNLQTSGRVMPKAPVPPQRSSGASADVGYSAVVSTADENTNATRAVAMPTTKVVPLEAMGKATANQKATGGNQRSAVAAAVVPTTAKRVSSTIIETSLLGSGTNKAASTLLTTASKTTKESLQEDRQQQAHPLQKIATEAATNSMVAQYGNESSKSDVVPAPIGSGLSPRLEMRLALNHDILGDEDLICYDPGPDLTRILGHDLSTFQRRTGRDLLSRSATNRVQPKEAVISFSQQRNSKMDTPTVNRRPRPSYGNVNTSLTTGLVGGARVGGVPQPLLPNRNTWSNSVSADRNSGVYARGDESSKSYNYSSDESKLSDLEILARREKTYCMSQLKSGSRVKTKTTATTTTMTMETMGMTISRDSLTSPQATRKSTSSMSMEIETGNVRSRKIGRDESALIEAGKGSRL
ncbi:serine-rich adhesin for platelets isoform X3 [Bactrocera oleae]